MPEKIDYNTYYDGEGDASPLTIDSNLDIGVSVTKENFQSVCMNYLYKIPFDEGGRCYGIGFSPSKNPMGGYNGLDSIGWLIFAYRNVTGETAQASVNPVSYVKKYPKSEVKAISDLEIGDIGMLSMSETDNHYGIFAGFYNGNPVFVHCSNEPDSVYGTGCLRMSYLKGVCDYYIEGSSPVDFRYFVRPDVEWEE